MYFVRQSTRAAIDCLPFSRSSLSLSGDLVVKLEKKIEQNYREATGTIHNLLLTNVPVTLFATLALAAQSSLGAESARSADPT